MLIVKTIDVELFVQKPKWHYKGAKSAFLKR